MTEEELNIKRLELEIAKLSKPKWRKPSYIILVLTVVVAAFIGFGQYMSKVKTDNIDKIERPKNTIAKNKEQQHKTEIATSKYETLMVKNENQEEKKRNKSLQEQSKLDGIEDSIIEKEVEFLRLKKKHIGFKYLIKKL